jgi:hypothetical protein
VESILTKLSAYSIIALQYLERQYEPVSLMEMCDLIPFSIPADDWDIDVNSLRSAIKPLLSQYLIVVSARGSGSARLYEITATGRDFLISYRSCLGRCGLPWHEQMLRCHERLEVSNVA